MDSKEKEIKVKRFSNRTARLTAAIFGVLLAGSIVLSLYFTGVFDSYPDLPEVMEGEATLSSNGGKEENYHITVDYKNKIVQLASMGPSDLLDKALFGRRLMSYSENGTINGTNSNLTKIIIQDYNSNRKYFIVPSRQNSTTKCIYTGLEGEMIPQHLLKHATLKSESFEGNTTHSHFEVDNDTDIDVYRAKGRNGKIYEVYLHLPNGSLHLRSKEQEMNFTAFRRLNCYRYYEENNTIEESFYNSTDEQFYVQPDLISSMINETLKDSILNVTETANGTALSASDLTEGLHSVHHRRRRGLGIRNGYLDWWYGNWCGPKQGGYTRYPKRSCNRFCHQSYNYITPGCRSCLPPKDGFDGACMEHDRCLLEAGKGPWWCQPQGNRCSCDFRFVWDAAYYTFACPSWLCHSHALQAFTAFHFLSCWFPMRFCFPWFRFSCNGCKICCPSMHIYWHCIRFKMCAPFGSGKIPF